MSQLKTHTLTKIDETLDSLTGAKWFSTLDLYSGYWQVEMEADDKPKTTFITRKGLFQFRGLPVMFRLHSSALWKLF